MKTFKEWKAEENPVKKGEKSIPQIRKENDVYKVVSVFDVAQTKTGKPEVVALSEKELYSVLVASSYYKVVETAEYQLHGSRQENGGKTGNFKSANSVPNQTIYLQEKLTEREKAGGLLKELCKLQSHGKYTEPARLAEYMLRSRYGLPVIPLPLITSADQLKKEMAAALEITRNLTHKIDANYRALQQEKTEVQPDYHTASIREDNEIDADRERTRENLGFRDDNTEKPPREPVVTHKSMPMATRLNRAQTEAQRRDMERKAQEKKLLEQASEKKDACVS